MITPKMTKTILNKMFHTSGIAGLSPAEEKEALVSSGVPENGVSAYLYQRAFVEDGYTASGPTTEKYNAYKATVNASEWWKTITTSAISQKYDWTDENGQDKSTTYTVSGWGFSQRLSPDTKYPTNAYLALFTQMPDHNGLNYKEPVAVNGQKTTYMRVNLRNAIISGNVCIKLAGRDPETGEAVIENNELFVFPEVFGVNWGTIVGFGIMPTKDAGDGTASVLWGRTVNPIVTKEKSVPLFRKGAFKTTLK